MAERTKLTTYNKLMKEFKDKVKKLQDSCPHKHLTPWGEIWWAPGHSTGSYNRRCRRCNAVVYTRYYAKFCEKCGHKNSVYLGNCFNCSSGNMIEYHVTERLGKIIKREVIDDEKEV